MEYTRGNNANLLSVLTQTELVGTVCYKPYQQPFVQIATYTVFICLYSPFWIQRYLATFYKQRIKACSFSIKAHHRHKG